MARSAYLGSLGASDVLDVRGNEVEGWLARELLPHLETTAAREVRFDQARFSGDAGFSDAAVSVALVFAETDLPRGLSLAGARFGAPLTLDRCTVGASEAPAFLDLSGAEFTDPVVTTGLKVTGGVRLDGSSFAGPVRISGLLDDVTTDGTRFQAESVLRPEGGRISLNGARLERPLTIAGTGNAKLSGLRGVDASNLILADLDLSECPFDGALHLDFVRFEGTCQFSRPPGGVRRTWAFPPLWRWTSRDCIADEHGWRASTGPRSKRDGWDGSLSTASAAQATHLYRALRKAQEDAKHEPGAADFYFGEMDSRRRATRRGGERILLWLYWLTAGYGLRASRAFSCLLVVLLLGIASQVAFGVPDSEEGQSVGLIAPVGGGVVTGRLVPLDPELKAPMSRRWTGKRTADAAEATINAVVFRSTAQKLTNTGKWIEAGVRVLGPLFLALALLSLRNRVKR
ncbi:pentapeptide repeat-containing protein [Spirillospora sp. CA-142024]|uniref:pentapeptide repeat-containing protein n=1 Tax=Spirillospora sp. CA-142024 TaxID=3240036 RepID=UPI003D91EF81